MQKSGGGGAWRGVPAEPQDKTERKNYALERESKKGAVHRKTCLYTLPQECHNSQQMERCDPKQRQFSQRGL